MMSEYATELQRLDRSHLLHVSTFTSPITGQLMTSALYRQADGLAKLHVIDPAEENGGFVEVLDRDEEVAFMLAELEAWEPGGTAD